MDEADVGTHGPDDAAPSYLDTLEGLGSLLYPESALGEQLDHVLALTAQTVPGSAAASVAVLGRYGGYVTAAASNDPARRLDAAQFELGAGPCVDALTTGREHLVADAADEDRWPGFVRLLRDHGLGSAVSMPLRAGDEVLGALTVFGGGPGGLHGHDLEAARQLAVPAAVTLANGMARRRIEVLTGQLQRVLDERALIEQAKGVLAAREGCHPDDAVGLLSRRARDGGREVVDVAREVVGRPG
jgi:GAF domain-containing protein